MDELGWLFVLLEASMRNIQYYGSPVRDVVNKNSTEPQAALTIYDFRLMIDYCKRGIRGYNGFVDLALKNVFKASSEVSIST